MKADEVKTVAVIGAGTMGAGITGELARAGCDVRLVDTSEELLERGMNLLRLAQDALIDAKLLPRRKAAAALKRVSLLSCMAEACEGVHLLVETVTENLIRPLDYENCRCHPQADARSRYALL